MNNYTHTGVDWGTGESQTWQQFVYTPPRPDTDGPRQKRDRLLVELKVGTTTGHEQRQWMRAQLYLCLGRRLNFTWNSTTMRG